MDYIRKLPLLLGLAGAIITGLVGYTHHVANNDNMARMMIVMAVFYVIGLMIRRTIFDIIETHKIKEQERKEEEELHREQKRADEMAEKENESTNTPPLAIDLAADEDIGINVEDEFSDLQVTESLNSELFRNNNL